MSRPFAIAWALLKGEYETDIQQAELFNPENTLQTAMQSYSPQMSRSPEEFAQDYMSMMANVEGAHAANIGDPDFDSQLGHSIAPTMIDATTERRLPVDKLNEDRLRELQAIREYAQFMGHPSDLI